MPINLITAEVGGGSISLDNPSGATDSSPSAETAAMHPRLHRQKLQSKTNRGKTFRSLKNKAVANIEVRIDPSFSSSVIGRHMCIKRFLFEFQPQKGFSYRSGTGTGDLTDGEGGRSV